MYPITSRALLVLASVFLTTGAYAQAPSFDDLQQLHTGEPPPARDTPAARPIPTPAPGTLVPSGRSSAAPAPPPSSGGGSSGASNSGAYFGAIAFTADGSYSTGWKYKTKAEAEAFVATKCAAFGRGECKVIAFVGTLCAGLASYQGSHSGRRYKLAYTGGGTTSSEAQQAAMNRCNADLKTRGRCQLRTVVCGDGR